jgi:hypothetical protein
VEIDYSYSAEVTSIDPASTAYHRVHHARCWLLYAVFYDLVLIQELLKQQRRRQQRPMLAW